MSSISATGSSSPSGMSENYFAFGFSENSDGKKQVCGSGFWGGQRPSLADYVIGTGATRGATAAGQC
jgi:hypothetical protein